MVLAGAALAYFLTRPDMVTVPDVTGQQEDAATIALHGAGFEVSTNSVQNDIPVGEVIEQDPSGNSEAEKGSTVSITVSLGPGTVEVPRVNGLPVDKAKKILDDAGFESEVDTRSSDSVPDGKVIGSNPSQGSSIAPGSTVKLIVSTGVKTEVVPNVLGLDARDRDPATPQGRLRRQREPERLRRARGSGPRAGPDRRRESRGRQ